MPDDEYMTFCCNDLEHPCDYRYKGMNREDVMEHAKAHVEKEHGLTGTSAEERIRSAIKSSK